MKKKYVVCVAALVISGVVAGGIGCRVKEKTVPVQKEEGEREAKTVEKEQFTFRDVESNLYTAPLLQNAAKNEFDYTRLTEQNGFFYYMDKNKKITSRIGVDVSKYQTDVNWHNVKESGIDFAIIRAGYRTYGESGTVCIDERFESHIKGAKEAGIEVGVYFFSQAVSTEETKEEARFVIELIRPYDITFPVVYDTEEIKNDTARTDGMTKEMYTQNCIAFCEEIKKNGYSPMIYANMKWLAFMLDLEQLQEYPIWYADYEAIPQNPYQFQMWQYTEKGAIPGMEGTFDLNLLFTSDSLT